MLLKRKVGGTKENPEELNSTVFGNCGILFPWLMQAFTILLLELTPKKSEFKRKFFFYCAIYCGLD